MDNDTNDAFHERLKANSLDLFDALNNCLAWTYRAADLEVSLSMKQAALKHAEDAKRLMDEIREGEKNI